MRTHTLHGKILSLAITGFAMLAADALAPAPFGSFVPEAQAFETMRGGESIPRASSAMRAGCCGT